jgi:hypothetical protein
MCEDTHASITAPTRAIFSGVSFRLLCLSVHNPEKSMCHLMMIIIPCENSCARLTSPNVKIVTSNPTTAKNVAASGKDPR